MWVANILSFHHPWFLNIIACLPEPTSILSPICWSRYQSILYYLFQESLSFITTLRALMDHCRFYSRMKTILTNFTTNVLSHKATSSRACQSTASVSVSTTSSNIPYRHLQSSSQSVSVTSEAVLNASKSPSPVSNGTRSPGDQGTVTLSNGSVLSSNASVQTQGSQSPISSLVPLLNERGLPSG